MTVGVDRMCQQCRRVGITSGSTNYKLWLIKFGEHFQLLHLLYRKLFFLMLNVKNTVMVNVNHSFNITAKQLEVTGPYCNRKYQLLLVAN